MHAWYNAKDRILLPQIGEPLEVQGRREMDWFFPHTFRESIFLLKLSFCLFILCSVSQ